MYEKIQEQFIQDFRNQFPQDSLKVGYERDYDGYTGIEFRLNGNLVNMYEAKYLLLVLFTDDVNLITDEFHALTPESFCIPRQ
jgi:hypothetical protein